MVYNFPFGHSLVCPVCLYLNIVLEDGYYYNIWKL
jgi:hypothetical protein